jgi:hypothetical protein
LYLIKKIEKIDYCRFSLTFDFFLIQSKIKCKRSCNLCGDLVQQKDRIQPTSKNYRSRRPSTIFSTNTPWNRFSYSDVNSNFNKFVGYDQTDQTSNNIDESLGNSQSVSANVWKSTTKEATGKRLRFKGYK